MSILRISETLYSKQRVNSVNAPTILPPGAPTPLNVNYIIVAGGGAGTGPTRGAENASDGGGAGGVLQGYTASAGSLGVGGTGYASQGSNWGIHHIIYTIDDILCPMTYVRLYM